MYEVLRYLHKRKTDNRKTHYPSTHTPHDKPRYPTYSSLAQVVGGPSCACVRTEKPMHEARADIKQEEGFRFVLWRGNTAKFTTQRLFLPGRVFYYMKFKVNKRMEVTFVSLPVQRYEQSQNGANMPF